MVEGVAAAILTLQQDGVPDGQYLRYLLMVVRLKVGARHTHLWTHTPGLVPGGDPAVRMDLLTLAIHFNPATGHPGLVIANLVGGPAIAVQVATILALLHHTGHDGLKQNIKGDGLLCIGLELYANTLQWLDDLIAYGPDVDCVRIAAQ